MKQFYSILFLIFSTVFVAGSVSTSVTLTLVTTPVPVPLCDTSCDLTISFPNGGTLTATEELTFTFGVGGVINLGEGGSVNVAVQPASLVFSTGGTLTLDVGESITFGVGGFINTVSGGDFNYTDIEVTTDVDFEVLLDEGSTQINVSKIVASGGGSLTITADGVVNIIGSLSVDGEISITSSSAISQTSSGIITADSLSTVSSGGTTLSSPNNVQSFSGTEI